MIVVKRPMRPLLTKTYSIIITSLGSTLDPLECSKSFARVWRGVLDDISVGVSSAESSKSFSNTEVSAFSLLLK